MAAKKPTMAQAYKAAAKPKDKGIVGEGKDVRLGFTYGQEAFHGPTERERQRAMEDSPRFKAGKIEKIPARQELI